MQSSEPRSRVRGSTTAGGPVIAIFCMKLAGHFNRLFPLIERLSGAGLRVVVFTHSAFRAEVEAVRAEFFDLFARHPLEGIDDETTPRSVRYVTYAAVWEESLAREVARLETSLVVYDTFAVVGRAVAHRLGLPHVNACAGHRASREAIASELRRSGFVHLSRRCLDAVRRLAARGLDDSDPFMYVATRSPFLNVHSEPPEFLEPGDATDVYFGSVRDAWATAARETFVVRPPLSSLPFTVYVSFGTTVRNYYPNESRRALDVIDETVTRLSWARSLVTRDTWVDQRRALEGASVFVTHQGLNSTHEAIVKRVPMLSYPFFWDQPALAEKCQAFGVARSLGSRAEGALTHGRVRDALERFVEEPDAFEAKLERARNWELSVMAGRAEVVRRIRGLAGARDELIAHPSSSSKEARA